MALEKSVIGLQLGLTQEAVRSFCMMELVESELILVHSRELIMDNISRDGMVLMLRHWVSKLWLKQLQVCLVELE